MAKRELGSVQFCKDWEKQGSVDQSLSNFNVHATRLHILSKCRFCVSDQLPGDVHAASSTEDIVNSVDSQPGFDSGLCYLLSG